MQVNGKLLQLAQFREMIENRPEPHAKIFSTELRSAEQIAEDREKQLDLQRHMMRSKMPLMATGIMPEKSQERFDALGLGDEWQRVRSHWQAKVAEMDVGMRATAGVSMLDDVKK